MRTFAIINQKGGCGKTTTSINLAAAFAALGRRTLLVDMDPQGHCGLGLAVPESRLEASMADALMRDAGGAGEPGRPFKLPSLLWQVSANLDLAPSTVALAGVEQRLAQEPGRDRRLRALLDRLRTNYELCIIDCPPSIGLLTFNALRAADEVIVPVETGYFALDGAIKQAATLGVLADRLGRAIPFHVLPTMYDVRSKMARKIVDELRKHFGRRVLETPIHFSAKLKDATNLGQPISEYDPASYAAQDFERLARHLLTADPIPPEAIHSEIRREALEERMDSPSLVPGGGVGAGVMVRERVDREAIRSNGEDRANDGAVSGGGVAAPPVNRRVAELVQRARELTERAGELHQRLATAPKSMRVDERIRDDAPPSDPQARRGLERRVGHLYGVRITRQGALFVQPRAKARRVSVAGDFNGWSPLATPLRRDPRLDIWQACVPLPPGRYRYRLVVDGQWSADPHNRAVETSPSGEVNSIVEVG